MNYRYTLDNRRGRGYIHICPKCEKRKFKRYVDTQTMQYVADNVGKCNRLIKCGYHYPPREYAKDNPQSKTTYMPTCHKTTPIFVNTQKKPSFLNADFVTQSMKNERYVNSFTRWLYAIIGKEPNYGIETVKKQINKYYLGGSTHMKDAVIFWQIDIRGNVRTGKIMRYDSRTGKRLKGNGYNYDWVHACLKRQQKIEDDFNLEQSFFGEHLLNSDKNATVAVFESEKTAIIASILYPRLICIATGGLSNLNASKCVALKGRNVIFFPDLGCFSQWKSKVDQISSRVFFRNYCVDDTLEKNATEEEKEHGFDLCDYIIKSLICS